MKKLLLLVATLAFALSAFAQTSVSSVPRPFVYGGLDLGDSPSYVVGAGLLETSKHFVFSGEASYDNDGKSNDNDNITRSGHDRRLKGSAYYRTEGGWFVGAGARWSKLYTVLYTKQQWHQTVGAGKDIVGPFFSTRIQGDYVLPQGAEHTSASGCAVPKGQCGSGVQGPEFSLFFPSPAVKAHLFARITIGAYSAHTTITSTDPHLTEIQKGHRIFLGETELTLAWRF